MPDLVRIRKDHAKKMEGEALAAELDAVANVRAAEKNFDDPQASTRAEQSQDFASKKRVLADNAHELAGTTATDFAGDARTDLKARRASVEESLLRERDKLEHPEAYFDPTAGADQEAWLDQRRWTVAGLTIGLEVIEERKETIEAQTSSVELKQKGPKNGEA
jgi:hypothetical protein